MADSKLSPTRTSVVAARAGAGATTKPKPEAFYAWYSDKQAKSRGVVVWRTEDGRKVLTTQITPDEHHGTEWEDTAYVGQVKEPVWLASRPLV